MTQFFEFFINHWFLWATFILLFFLVVRMEILTYGGGGQALSPQETIQWMNRKRAVLVDVRATDAFQKGHIRTALNLPSQEVSNMLKKLKKHRAKPIILYGDNGQDPLKAVQLLKKEGFEQVLSLKGGIITWRKENLPIVSSNTP